MNMTALFDDFMRYVDSMDEGAVKRSIADAAAHTSDSYILDGVPDSLDVRNESVTQSLCMSRKSKAGFSFCSVALGGSETSFNPSAWGGDAA